MASEGSDTGTGRYGNMPGDHKRQNKQVEKAVKKYGLSKDQRRQLHDEISHMGYGFQGIDEIAQSIAEQGGGKRTWKRRKSRKPYED